MATTAQSVFDAAMALTDNMTDNADYLSRFIPVANIVLTELYPYSDSAVVTSGKKPVPTFIANTSSVVDLDDALALGVMPHGVIALLFTDEPSTANFHQQLYEQKLRKLSQIPAESEDIENIYGSLTLTDE
jgi:hypothetical protein